MCKISHMTNPDTISLDMLPLQEGGIRLRADMLPPTVWGSNIRAMALTAGPKLWDALRFPVCAAAKNLCESCGNPAPNNRRPDCHERWEFTTTGPTPVQRLRRLVALCPTCHEVQHIGLANIKGRIGDVQATLMRINNWTAREAKQDLQRAEHRYQAIKEIEFDLDLSVLKGQLVWPGNDDLYWSATDRAELGNVFTGR